MPISDGYEACKKIFDLFNQEKIFSHQESLIQINENPAVALPFQNNNRRGQPQIPKVSSKITFMNFLQRKMPMLVACSSTISTPELEKELTELGFDMFIEQPISNDKVHELVELLVLRE